MFQETRAPKSENNPVWHSYETSYETSCSFQLRGTGARAEEARTHEEETAEEAGPGKDVAGTHAEEEVEVVGAGARVACTHADEEVEVVGAGARVAGAQEKDAEAEEAAAWLMWQCTCN